MAAGAGAVIGGVGAAVTGGDVLQGLGFGAAFGLAGYGLSTALSDVAGGILERGANAQLDSLADQINAAAERVMRGDGSVGGEISAESVQYALDEYQNVAQQLKRLGAELNFELDAAAVKNFKFSGFDIRGAIGLPNRVPITLPRHGVGLPADTVFQSSQPRVMVYSNGRDFAAAAVLYGPSGRLVTNQNLDLSYGRVQLPN